VTPHLVDHSAYDSYALVIDGGGRRLMYTGDLRGHGRKGSLFDAMVTQPPSDVDVLLMEGTHVTDPAASAVDPTPAQRSAASETDLERDLAATFTNTAGLAVVVSSAQNIDRLVTVYRATRRANRVLLVDLYTATVAAATGRDSIPRPGFPHLGVYVPNRQRVAVKSSGQFHRTEAIRSVRAFPEQIAADPSRYVVLSSGSTVAELLTHNALTPHGVVVWSLWSGYLRERAGRRLKETLVRAGVPLIEAHTSGHASVADLRRLVAAINPGRVVPIHTDAPHAFAGLFARATPVADGDWWNV
jgi:ribonuclease J